MIARLKARARALNTELGAVYLAARDPRTPNSARLVAVLVAAYAFSPIDLIPDFIPVLGYVDDLVLLPMGIWLAIRLIPPDVMADCRQRAEQNHVRPVNYSAAAVIALVWAGASAIIVCRLL